MTVAVPGLWWRAEAELARLTAAIAKSPKEIKPLVRSVDAKAKAEFAVVSNALDARFGPDAIARGDPAVIDCVPAAQHKVFEAMQPRLKALQQAARIERSPEIDAERQRTEERRVGKEW